MYSWPGRYWKTSGSCCTCTLGSCGYVSELSVVAPIEIIIFTMLYHFLAIRNKPPCPMLQALNREEWYNTHYEPSQQARTQSLCGSNLTRSMNNNTILLEYMSKPPLNRIRIQKRTDFMWWTLAMCIQCSLWNPCEHVFRAMWTGCLGNIQVHLLVPVFCSRRMYDVVEWVLWCVIYVL